MNEQDIIDTILKKTEDISIPDSISPENMKKMLDEQVVSDLDSTTPSSATPRRKLRRYTAAACAALCLITGITVFTLHSNLTKDNQLEADEALEMAAEATAQDCEEEKDDCITVTIEDPVVDNHPTDLVNPESYEDYYNTLKSAYDSYYDSFAQVETNEILEDSMVKYQESESEISKDAGEDSVVEDYYMEEAEKGDIFQSATPSKEEAIRGEENQIDEHSTTNTQEKDVDEGDIVKTDGQYIYRMTKTFDQNLLQYTYKIYITSANDGKMEITSCIDFDKIMNQQTQTKWECTFDDMYVKDDSLIVLYHNNPVYSPDDIGKNESFITILNIKDRKQPKLIKTLSQSGYLESSRISDGYLYTISNFYNPSLSTPTPYTNYIPKINGEIIGCDNIFYAQNPLMKNTYVITSVSLNNPTDFVSQLAIPARGGSFYVSNSAIYIYGTIYDNTARTEIVKVFYEDGTLRPGMTATVSGYLYDSFALNEYDGFLRVVATIPANNISILRSSKEIIVEDVLIPDDQPNSLNEDINALYILDSDMKLAGKLSGIAPGETIQSARFMGDIGYFVTYRNTDPLFTVDLSDPYNPVILDELTIPGFSNYLHPYSKDLLLGFGVATDPETQDFLGLKLSMFDVSNKLHVTEIENTIIKNANYSEAQYNHRAMMIDPEKNIFGFLYVSYGDYEVEFEDKYFYVTYRYDKKDGFVQTGKYQINDSSAGDVDTVRGIYIGDYLYISTDESITSFQIGTSEPIETLRFK